MHEKREHNKITIDEEIEMIIRKAHIKTIVIIVIIGAILCVAANVFAL